MRHVNSTSFRPGIDPRTGQLAMTPDQLKIRQKEYYHRHKKKTIYQNWIRQIAALGCTPEMYAELLEAQDHVCAICRQSDPSGKRLSVDHDHRTGTVRGLLCSWCNRALGLLRDDFESMKRAVKYLEK